MHRTVKYTAFIMASREEIFSAVIKLNDQEATSKLKKMETQLTALKKRRDEALQHGKIDVWKAANKEIDKLEGKIKKQNQLIGTMNHTLDSLSTAKQKELEQIVKDINRHLNSGAVERNSKEWKELNECLRQARHELSIIRSEGELQISLWGRFTGFLNKNWGAITQIFGAISGISITIRNTVNDYAAMEQEMANVRKYTGQTAEEVEELNEHLKKIDTRTSREELNQLAGAAGRLGITATDQDFVIEVSDDPSKGNVMITNILGLKSDGTATSGSFIKSTSVSGHEMLSAATYTAGSPIYCTMNGTTITTPDPYSQDAFVYYNGDPVYFAQNNNNAVALTMSTSTEDSTTTVTLTPGNINISLPVTMDNASTWAGCLKIGRAHV